MSKFITLTTKNGISTRPFHSGDKASETKEGITRVHGSRELACAQMDKFWKARGYNIAKIGAGR